MRSNLSIYDVSAYVYAGATKDGYRTRTYYNYPVGGIHYLMKYLISDIKSGKDVALTFDSRSFRKDLMKSYKAGRQTNYAVYSQLEFLYEYLSKCGFACYKKSDYEADDLIYNIVNQSRNNYLQIFVYGVDYDLTHNVDDGKVKFCAATSQVNSISAINFSTSIVRGEIIWFNTISAYKVFMGDHSDGIPAFKSARGISGRTLYNKFVDVICKSKQPLRPLQTRSRQLLENYIKCLDSVLFEDDKKELKLRMDVVFPAELEGDFTNASTEKSINMEALRQFVSLVDDRDSLKFLNGYRSPLTEDMINVLRRKAKELSTGEFAVDRNKTVNPISVNTAMLNLKEF